MKKEQVIKGAVKLIEQIANDKGLTVVNKGTGHAFDGGVWEGLLKDDSNIPNVIAKGEGYSIELRSFWGNPEIDVHRAGDYGEELLIFNYSDSEKLKSDTEYRHTGNLMVQQVRVEAKCDYRSCVNEVYAMIERLEVYGLEDEYK